ncbi:hypothetical protein [Altererythrobacter sp. MF3-039]|uniref:hypothetical protein n=1 Tax=Altererythrobacter sp. MF3-039 TaxID=3252901 RepID=UPI00390CAD67
MITILAPLALLQAASGQAAQTPPPPPPACDKETHAGFDFWVGEWDVYPSGTDNKVADSKIERKHNGCAVIESWMPLNGAGGTSLNNVDALTGHWRQKWVGSSPGAVEFSGGVVDGTMVLTGTWPSPGALTTLIRMTYTPNEDGSVRQHGEASTDHGVSWQTSFDFIYRPKPKEQT